MYHLFAVCQTINKILLLTTTTTTTTNKQQGWLRVSAVERRSLAGELSLSCARPVADG